MYRIWIDLNETSQVNQEMVHLASYIGDDAEYLVTTSDPRVKDLNFPARSSFKVIPKDPDPIHNYGRKIIHLLRHVQKHNPELLVSDLDPAAVRTAFGLGIPIWTIYTNEPPEKGREKSLSLPLCDKIFTSNQMDEEKLVREGIQREQLARFPQALSNRIPEN